MRTSGQCVVTFLFCYITLGIELPYALVFSLIDVFIDLGRHRRGPVYIPSRVTHEPYSVILSATGIVAVLALVLRLLRLLDLSPMETLLLGLYVGIKHWLLDLAVVPGAYINGRLLYLTVLRDDYWLSAAACIVATLLLYLRCSSTLLLMLLLPLSLEPVVYLPGLAILYVFNLLLKAVLGVSLLSFLH